MVGQIRGLELTATWSRICNQLAASGDTAVSDTNPEKTQRELDQVRAFLRLQRMDYEAIERGPDPPDVIVRRVGALPLGIEITAYHPDEDRMGLEKRSGQFRDVLYDMIRESPKLKSVLIQIFFHDGKAPRANRHSPVGAEMVRCVEYAVDQGWVGEAPRKISFVDGWYDTGDHWIILPSAEWPLLAESVDLIQVSRMSWDGYFPSHDFSAQAAYSSPYPEAFYRLLAKKEAAIRDAIQSKKYVQGEGPLWLLILSNIQGDLASHIFAEAWLREAVEDSGFDFGHSVFEAVWLMDVQGDGRSQRLYPWEEAS